MTCSGEGVLRVWDESNLSYQRATRVGIRVTHAVLLSRSKKIAVSAIDRSIRFFDAMTLEPLAPFFTFLTLSQLWGIIIQIGKKKKMWKFYLQGIMKVF